MVNNNNNNNHIQGIEKHRKHQKPKDKNFRKPNIFFLCVYTLLKNVRFYNDCTGNLYCSAIHCFFFK